MSKKDWCYFSHSWPVKKSPPQPSLKAVGLQQEQCRTIQVRTGALHWQSYHTASSSAKCTSNLSELGQRFSMTTPYTSPSPSRVLYAGCVCFKGAFTRFVATPWSSPAMRCGSKQIKKIPRHDPTFIQSQTKRPLIWERERGKKKPRACVHTRNKSTLVVTECSLIPRDRMCCTHGRQRLGKAPRRVARLTRRWLWECASLSEFRVRSIHCRTSSHGQEFQEGHIRTFLYDMTHDTYNNIWQRSCNKSAKHTYTYLECVTFKPQEYFTHDVIRGGFWTPITETCRRPLCRKYTRHPAGRNRLIYFPIQTEKRKLF